DLLRLGDGAVEDLLFDRAARLLGFAFGGCSRGGLDARGLAFGGRDDLAAIRFGARLGVGEQLGDLLVEPRHAAAVLGDDRFGFFTRSRRVAELVAQTRVLFDLAPTQRGEEE